MQITDLQMVHKQLNNSYIPQYIVAVNIEMSKCGIEGKCSQKHNTHYLRIKCVLQAHHENNAYCAHLQHHYCLICIQPRIGLTVAKKLTLMEGVYHYCYLHECHAL